MTKCNLCQSGQPEVWLVRPERRSFHCKHCHCAFVDQSDWLSPSEEAACYRKHCNDPEQQGYRQFLSQLSRPLVARLALDPSNERGLDFGCGPGPTLSIMIQEAGYQMELYDPIFAPDPSVLAKRYDFVTMSEVAEHLRNPMQVFRNLALVLQPGGVLAVMTKRLVNQADFASWYYRRDPTHIVFYAPQTFMWIGSQTGLSVEFISDDVVFLVRTGDVSNKDRRGT